MPNITLEKKEGLYLRAQICKTYETETRQKLVINSVRANYVGLSDEITKSVIEKTFDNYRFNKGFEASDAQLQSLFFREALTFRDDFVHACYCYAFGQTRTAFFKASKNDALINSWRTVASEIPQNTEGGESTEKLSLDNNNISQQNQSVLVSDIHDTDRPVTPISKPRVAFSRFNILFFTALLAVVSLSIALFKTQQKLHKTLLWYKPLPVEEEIELKKDLGFVDAPIFKDGIRKLVKSLIQGHQNLVAKQWAKPNRSILEWYRNENASKHFCYTGQGGYSFCIDRCNWTGFNKEENPNKTGFVEGVEDTVYTLFTDFSSVLLDTLSKYAPVRDVTYLNELLNIPSDYSVILIYVGYKADINNYSSRELMVRYPTYDSFSNHEVTGYMTMRQWWKDARNRGRRDKFSWKDSIDNQSFYMGLSVPHPPIRRNLPNQRVLWVEIPLELPIGNGTVMIMGIDLLKND